MIVILARYRVHFIIEHENLVFDLSNNISIILENYDSRDYSVTCSASAQRQRGVKFDSRPE